MKRPSIQFYPGDWRSNAKLRRCSPAARGVWMDVICLLHDSDEYGLVRWPLAEIARAAGAAIAHVRELASKGVLKGNDTRLEEAFIYTPRSGRKDGEPVTLIPTQAGPIWYSSRMVKDEYVRTIRGQSSRFGDGEGAASKASPKPPKGDGSSSSSSSSDSSFPKGKGDGAPPDRDLFPDPIPLEKQVFDRGKELLGKKAGGLIAKLRKKFDYDDARVLSLLELAATKHNPAEYIGRLVAGEREETEDEEIAEIRRRRADMGVFD